MQGDTVATDKSRVTKVGPTNGMAAGASIGDGVGSGATTDASVRSSRLARSSQPHPSSLDVLSRDGGRSVLRRRRALAELGGVCGSSLHDTP